MLQNPRARKSFKAKIIAYILLLTILVFFIFLINSLFLLQKPLFINPMGEDNISAKQVERLFREKNILFSHVLVLSDSSYSVSIPNNGLVRLSSQKNINKQMSSLQRILRELTIEGKQFKIIDFRFEEPIISF